MAAIRLMLPAYLDAVVKRRWKYGDLDCCTFMADWLIRLGFPDVMADRRGAYSTLEEYRLLIRSEGGMVSACRRRFGEARLTVTDKPMIGDVALVMTPVRVRKSGRIVSAATGSICASDRARLVVTPDAGLVRADLQTVLAWKVARG